MNKIYLAAIKSKGHQTMAKNQDIIYCKLLKVLGGETLMRFTYVIQIVSIIIILKKIHIL